MGAGVSAGVGVGVGAGLRAGENTGELGSTPVHSCSWRRCWSGRRCLVLASVLGQELSFGASVGAGVGTGVGAGVGGGRNGLDAHQPKCGGSHAVQAIVSWPAG